MFLCGVVLLRLENRWLRSVLLKVGICLTIYDEEANDRGGVDETRLKREEKLLPSAMNHFTALPTERQELALL